MPRIDLVIGRDPRALLEHAAGAFLAPMRGTPERPFPSPPYLLALRQGGLRDDLMALAAGRGVAGWFDPPLCVFAELPEWLGRTQREPCGDFARAALLADVLRRSAGEVFGRPGRAEHFLDAVERLFGELVAEDVAPEAFRAALATLPDRDAFEESRDAELAAAYALYLAELSKTNARDGRDALADTARAIALDPAALAAGLGGRREIRFFGLADLRGGWRPLLRALAGSPALDRIVVYTAEDLALERELAGETTRLPDPKPLQRFTLIPAPEIDGELEAVAMQVRRLLDAGTPPERVAVVSRDARPHQDIAVRALERCGVPVTARRRFAYLEIPVVRSVLALFAAAADGWPRHRLIELADQPYLRGLLDGRILNFIGYRRRIEGLERWSAALADLEREAKAREDPARRDADEHARWVPPSRWVAEAAARFARFKARVAALDDARPLAAWLAWLEAFLAEDPWQIVAKVRAVPDERFDIARLDLAGWAKLGTILREWREATERWEPEGPALEVEAFHRRLSAMLDADAALWTGTDRGVRVLEGLAATYRSFDHVFVAGMDAGRFPKPMPASPLYAEPERAALRAAGLPLDLRADWDRRERALFDSLAASAARSLTLSYVALDEFGAPRIESAFVEALGDASRRETLEGEPLEEVLGAVPLHREGEVAAHAHHAATMEASRAAGIPSPHQGLVTDPALVSWLAQEFGDARLWSPTQLEAYAKCPWAYFSGRLLRIEKLEDPDEDIDPIERGNVLHDALRRFYEKAKAKLKQPVLLTPGCEEWAVPMLRASLEEALADAKAKVWLGHPALHEAKRQELLRVVEDFLAWEIADNHKLESKGSRKNFRILRTAVDAHELAFDEIVLERDGIRFRFRGRIDRVEVGVDPRVDSQDFVAAVDYKSSRSGVPGAGDDAAWDDGVMLQLPLYASALLGLMPDAKISRVEYRTLRGGASKVPLQLVLVEGNTAVVDAEGAARLGAALDAVVRHVKAVRAGEFPVRPAPSCGCPPFCHAWDICRVPGGPRSKWDR
jgi:ATP-dependent helicase/nuclease subunit B